MRLTLWRSRADRRDTARAYLALGTVDAETEARKHLDLIVTAYHSGTIQPEDQNAETFLIRGRILFGREKFLLAMKDFEAALALAPSRRDIMVEFGRSLFEQARYDDASAYFKQVLQGDSLNPTANYYMGRIYMRENRTEDATKHLIASVKRSPSTFPDAHRMLGMIYKDKGMHAMARDSFKSFLKYTDDRKSSEALEVQRLLEKNSY